MVQRAVSWTSSKKSKGSKLKVSDRGLDLVKKFEGCELDAYEDPGMVLTIGYGHTEYAAVFQKVGITLSWRQAEQLLSYDMGKVEQTVNLLVKAQLSQLQYDAICSLVFNIGTRNFATSTLLRKVNGKNWDEAMSEFSRWIHQKGRILPGLVTRRAAEEALFKEGTAA
jgi:lysozyme